MVVDEPFSGDYNFGNDITASPTLLSETRVKNQSHVSIHYNLKSLHVQHSRIISAF